MNLERYTGLTQMMVFATTDSVWNPFTCNVYYKIDWNSNFYFVSRKETEHWCNIINNWKAAWSIINTQQHPEKGLDKIWMQVTGKAKILEWAEAKKLYEELFADWTYEDLLKSDHHIFQCIPSRIKIWDDELYWDELKVIEVYEKLNIDIL